MHSSLQMSGTVENIRHVLLIRSGHTELLIRSGYAAILFATSIGPAVAKGT